MKAVRDSAGSGGTDNPPIWQIHPAYITGQTFTSMGVC
jgi:hypothetical protein